MDYTPEFIVFKRAPSCVLRDPRKNLLISVKIAAINAIGRVVPLRSTPVIHWPAHANAIFLHRYWPSSALVFFPPENLPVVPLRIQETNAIYLYGFWTSFQAKEFRRKPLLTMSAAVEIIPTLSRADNPAVHPPTDRSPRCLCDPRDSYKFRIPPENLHSQSNEFEKKTENTGVYSILEQHRNLDELPRSDFGMEF